MKIVSIKKRFIAFTLDGYIMLLFSLVYDSPILVPILFWCLCFIMLASSFQTTPGGLATKIYLVTTGGQKVPLTKIALREAVACLSKICLSLGYLKALIHPKNQTWHDSAAGILVIADKRISRPLHLTRTITTWLLLLSTLLCYQYCQTTANKFAYQLSRVGLLTPAPKQRPTITSKKPSLKKAKPAIIQPQLPPIKERVISTKNRIKYYKVNLRGYKNYLKKSKKPFVSDNMYAEYGRIKIVYQPKAKGQPHHLLFSQKASPLSLFTRYKLSFPLSQVELSSQETTWTAKSKDPDFKHQIMLKNTQKLSWTSQTMFQFSHPVNISAVALLSKDKPGSTLMVNKTIKVVIRKNSPKSVQVEVLGVRYSQVKLMIYGEKRNILSVQNPIKFGPNQQVFEFQSPKKISRMLIVIRGEKNFASGPLPVAWKQKTK